MAKAADTRTSKDDLEDQAAAQAAVEDAVRPGEPAERSKGELEAERAELARQKAVEDAVSEAHRSELPNLGGPNLSPGGSVEGEP